MNVIKALQVVRDLSSPFDVFIGAAEYLQMYREGNMVVHYCDILCDYVYIELSVEDRFYLDFLSI